VNVLAARVAGVVEKGNENASDLATIGTKKTTGEDAAAHQTGAGPLPLTDEEMIEREPLLLMSKRRKIGQEPLPTSIKLPLL